MLPLCFVRPDLFRNVLVDQVCAPHFTVYQQRDAMQCQIKNLPVFAPLSHCPVQRVSGEDLRNQLPGVRSFIVRYPDIPNINRGELVPVDGWRCQSCGTRLNLEVHHKELRSRSGDDSEQNLITLCTACQWLAHRGTKLRMARV